MMMKIHKPQICGMALTLMMAASALTFTPAQVQAQSIVKTKDIHLPDYYDTTVRAAFKRGNWEGGKRLLDEGLKRYPDVSTLNELAGRYYYHKIGRAHV